MASRDYSISFYTGGIDVGEWQNLSKEQREVALRKNWYIRWSYRHPETLKLVKQPHIKAGVNRFKTMTDRISFMRTYKRGMIECFEEGMNPFSEDGDMNGFEIPSVVTAGQAVDDALKIKKLHMKPSSFVRFKSDIRKFRQYLRAKGFETSTINGITKQTVSKYLNEVLKEVSARSRNNYRASISSLWQCMENEGVIPGNFVKTIPMLRSVPQRNRTYTDGQVEALFEYMETNCPELLLFVKFVSYNFLRPIEVCRLTVGSFDLSANTVTVLVKQGAMKTKTIPDILLNELPDMNGKDPADLIFAKDDIIGKWDVTEDYRRGYYTGKFREIKKVFGLGPEYGIYSFRHYFVSKLYRKFRNTYSPFETKSRMLLITGHKTINALEKYLRSIDAEISEDYSDML